MLAKPMIKSQAYWQLCKPKVVMTMLLTSWVGMRLANSTAPLSQMLFALLGIGLLGGAAATINQLLDRGLDSRMQRTQLRPLVKGCLGVQEAIVFALTLSCLGTWILWQKVNGVTAALSVLTLIGYAFLYTVFLKKATPQNIVIGGLSGAMPPLLGWTAVRGQIDPEAWLLVLIIFTWTPPHFWALALAKREDYQKAAVPMLPLTHGVDFTCLNILLYSVLLLPVVLLPYLVGLCGMTYALGASLMTGAFIYGAYRLYQVPTRARAYRLFEASIVYLLVLFMLMMLV